jgi:hypothetical protein
MNCFQVIKLVLEEDSTRDRVVNVNKTQRSDHQPSNSCVNIIITGFCWRELFLTNGGVTPIYHAPE